MRVAEGVGELDGKWVLVGYMRSLGLQGLRKHRQFHRKTILAVACKTLREPQGRHNCLLLVLHMWAVGYNPGLGNYTPILKAHCKWVETLDKTPLVQREHAA